MTVDSQSYRLGLACSSQLRPALQPIVDSASGRLIGVEALARFTDGRSFDDWCMDGARAGQPLLADRAAFLAAVELIPQLPADCYVAINASPELLMHPMLSPVRDIEPHLRHRIVVEVTEHARIADYIQLLAQVQTWRDQGIRLSVDDTGAGYASLSHVLHLRPDIIKVDRALIANVATDGARRVLVTALVLLALELGATVTAEGIETTEDLEAAVALGVDGLQGFALARPTDDPIAWRSWATAQWPVRTGARDDVAYP